MSEDKFDQAILKIFKLTHSGVIEWSKSTPPESIAGGSDSVISVYFEATYQGRTLGLFHERFRRQGGTLGMARTIAELTGIAADSSQWGERARLVLLYEDGAVAYSFPYSRVTKDLLETVRYKTSGVDQFLDELLNTEN
ncbi:hypothetical protein [Duganella radicis]|uniref:Uncharacterized protein n=1 Tax=Duganella radicis TaxID=551988 RepID=A0A6L6PQU4_9BURK|nr:hypothetical protein [Duganella radicis]MTV41486.1 hypothetical protein [Duganella radicis]